MTIFLYGLAIVICYAVMAHTFIGCLLFGHQPPLYRERGWWSPGEQYVKADGGQYVDNCGRHHLNLYSDCPRCSQKFLLCRIHVPDKQA